MFLWEEHFHPISQSECWRRTTLHELTWPHIYWSIWLRWCSATALLIGGFPFYTSQILRAAKYTTTSFTSLLVQLFQMILLKLGYDNTGTLFFKLLFPSLSMSHASEHNKIMRLCSLTRGPLHLFPFATLWCRHNSTGSFLTSTCLAYPSFFSWKHHYAGWGTGVGCSFSETWVASAVWFSLISMKS